MLADTIRLVKDEPERLELTEAERDLIATVRERMECYGTHLHELIDETGTDRRVVAAMLRDGLGIDEYPALLSEWERGAACKKLSAWVERMDAEEASIEQAERRMAGIHTISSLSKLLKINPMHLGMVLSRQKDMGPSGMRMNKPRILETLATWLESDPEMDASIGMAQTPTSSLLRQGYGLAQATRSMVFVVADVGIGKTYTAKACWRENPKTYRSPGVVYVEFSKGDTTESAILGRIVEALHAQGLIATPTGEPMTIITETLGEDDLLLLDEVHFTFDKGSRSGEVFHSLFNIKPMPIVLQGNNDLKRTIWSDKKQTFAGLANRSYRLPDMCTTNEDVDAWMEWAGYDDSRLKSAARKIAARPGQNGGLRTLANIITAFEKTRPGVKLTATNFRDLVKTLGKA